MSNIIISDMKGIYSAGKESWRYKMGTGIQASYSFYFFSYTWQKDKTKTISKSPEVVP